MTRVELAAAECARAFGRYRTAAHEAARWVDASAQAAARGEVDEARAHAQAHRAACEARRDALRHYDRTLHELHAALLAGASCAAESTESSASM